MKEELTKNFDRWEFTVSQTAARQSILNVPSEESWTNLKALAENILEPTRDAMGRLRISSGYRSPELNAAIGGAPNSQHCKGEAADVIPMDCSLADMFVWIYANTTWDTLIWEFGQWCHVSHRKDGQQRKQALLAYRKDGKTIYVPMSEEQVYAL